MSELTVSYEVERKVYEFLTRKPFWKSTTLEKCTLPDDMTTKPKVSYPLGSYFDIMDMSRNAEPNFYFNIAISHEMFTYVVNIAFSDDMMDTVDIMKKIFSKFDKPDFKSAYVSFTDNDDSRFIVTFTKEERGIMVSFDFGTSKNNDKQMRHSSGMKILMNEQIKYSFTRLIKICDEIRDL